MRHLLAASNIGILEPIARSRVLLAFDFDGTLAPIVVRHQAAQMRKRTRALFARLCRLYPCAVISGRSLADVALRVEGLPALHVIGNHGAEPGSDLAAFARDVRGAAPILREALRRELGVEIEDKKYSFAVHYRQSRNKRAAERAIYAAAAALPVPMRCIAGKLLVNIVPSAAPTKGDALLDLRAKAKADLAVFVGDDVTDEDVFQLDQPGRLLGIRVGRSQTSAAAYFLRDQSEIDGLLARLVALRSKGASSR